MDSHPHTSQKNYALFTSLLRKRYHNTPSSSHRNRKSHPQLLSFLPHDELIWKSWTSLPPKHKCTQSSLPTPTTRALVNITTSLLTVLPSSLLAQQSSLHPAPREHSFWSLSQVTSIFPLKPSMFPFILRVERKGLPSFLNQARPPLTPLLLCSPLHLLPPALVVCFLSLKGDMSVPISWPLQLPFLLLGSFSPYPQMFTSFSSFKFQLQCHHLSKAFPRSNPSLTTFSYFISTRPINIWNLLMD